ncbi:helix-turn-helix transcriptional regulator [Paenibacillus sp. GXUN7292]|uniref:helix-turn-helix transcriptional regulator n=1 Tax=Paenibacillus sp. GXUN7292 TaxID=3422499 RepID=UPI003D7DA94F
MIQWKHVANFAGLKRSYFHELFLRETGMTPKSYQHKLLMKRASQLLRESNLAVTAITDKLGYLTFDPFTQHFSAYYGVSPKQYRLNPKRLEKQAPSLPLIGKTKSPIGDLTC